MAAAPFNWNEFLNLANTLSGNGDEASHRTSISRAYYAAFHAATDHAKANGYNERSHGRLWKMYGADADINAKRLSAIGNFLKRQREQADYATAVPRVNYVNDPAARRDSQLYDDACPRPRDITPALAPKPEEDLPELWRGCPVNSVFTAFDLGRKTG